MAKFEIKSGLDEYIAKLQELGVKTEGIIKMSIYDGAAVVADAVKANIQSLPVVKDEKFTPEKQGTGITATQKQGLIDGLGIARMRDDGGKINTRIGFHGRNRTHTRKYTQGQPNVMIVRSLEYGTSIRQKHPFVGPAIRKCKAAAIDAMRKKFDEETKNIMGG